MIRKKKPNTMNMEQPEAVQTNRAYVRFVHLSPNAPSVDITLPNGPALFSDVTFEETTEYIEVRPATYTLQVRPARNTNQVVLSVPNVTLEPGKVYTVYAVGLLNEDPALSALYLEDGV
ncbi:DUF4397 domain-containing protein [Haloplasma contractile]|uniref:DUF4397 domain-containing protein n=1 Tax=Haloplasma contractile SSD-17B TaxID=1033810 RepID=U2FJG7_9MOLU|nr:DUF4397 domain-containing protein [Haloplasma contractile]ERJ12975.1 hypothetical protein HLPCO_000574 [Haloplasma contractile SSD-17B]